MKWLCRMVGHKPPVYAKSGWYSPGEQYGEVNVLGEDGIGRVHAFVKGKCTRCGDTFVVVRIHVPKLKEKPCPS